MKDVLHIMRAIRLVRKIVLHFFVPQHNLVDVKVLLVNVNVYFVSLGSRVAQRTTKREEFTEKNSVPN